MCKVSANEKTACDYMSKIVNAIRAGRSVECRSHKIRDSNWYPIDSVALNFCDYEYRVKPKPRRLWVVDNNGSTSVHFSEELATAKVRESCGPVVTVTEFVEVVKNG